MALPSILVVAAVTALITPERVAVSSLWIVKRQESHPDARCAIPYSEKEDCGHYGIDEEQCLERDCCWMPSQKPNDPWCYIPQRRNNNNNLIINFIDTSGKEFGIGDYTYVIPQGYYGETRRFDGQSSAAAACRGDSSELATFDSQPEYELVTEAVLELFRQGALTLPHDQEMWVQGSVSLPEGAAVDDISLYQPQVEGKCAVLSAWHGNGYDYSFQYVHLYTKPCGTGHGLRMALCKRPSLVVA